MPFYKAKQFDLHTASVWRQIGKKWLKKRHHAFLNLYKKNRC